MNIGLDALLAEIRAAGPCPLPERERMTMAEIASEIAWCARDTNGYLTECGRALRQLLSDRGRLAEEVERLQDLNMRLSP